MPELHPTRRSITSRINKILSDYGLENAVSGGKYDDLRQGVSNTTGYWEGRSVPSKPSRLIVHLRQDNGIYASIPEDNDNGNFAYANTARRPVGGLAVRILPVIRLGDEDFVPYPNWEWLLWYCFWPKLKNGSSGQVFDGFDPLHGTFTYMGEIQPYITAGLITLIEPGSNFENRDHGIRFNYGEATEAIRQLIRFAPILPEAEGQNDA